MPAETSKDRTAVLAIAYHNMGVEQEFLRSYPAAILSYKKAVNFAEKNLGPEDGITQNLRNVFENAKVEVSMIGLNRSMAHGRESNLNLLWQLCIFFLKHGSDRGLALRTL